MLEIKNLSVGAGPAGAEVEILRGINLTIGDGRFVVLTGPNGSGKTTLAKAIMGLMPEYTGEIIWNGAELSGLSITERARLGISYGFQQPARFKGLKVSDLLDIAAGGALSIEDSCRYMSQVGLCADDYIGRELDSSLSGGEVKRIEIATILAKGAPLMIFDEPEAGIDLWSFSKLTETFKAIHESTNATLLIISHQERIISLADEIVLISDGTVAQHGPRGEVFPHILENVAGGCTFLGA